jgi:hypothetical protein
MTSNCIFCGRVVSAHVQDFIRVQRDNDTFQAHELCAPPCAKCRTQILPQQTAVSFLTHQDGKRVIEHRVCPTWQSGGQIKGSSFSSLR